tara:strand:- start:18 stop:197 length:180 start_codon:yes stop_codon:yes gene_type:complete
LWFRPINKTRKPKEMCDIVLAKSNLDFKIEFTKSKKDESIRNKEEMITRFDKIVELLKK